MQWEKWLAERSIQHLAERHGCAVAFSAGVVLVCGPPGKVEVLLACLDLGVELDLPSVTFDGVTCVALCRCP